MRKDAKMTDFFILQWHPLIIASVLMIIIGGAVIVFGIIPQSIEDNELRIIQKDLIENSECEELGGLILSGNLIVSLKDFADRHWSIRCI